MDDKSNDVKLHKVGYFLSEQEIFEKVCSETGTKTDEEEYSRHPLAFLMEAADDIAYSTADLEDALKKDMFTVDEFIDYFKGKCDGISDASKKSKSIELINDLERRIDETEIRDKESDLIAFQKWTEFTAKVLGVTYRDNTIFIKPHIRGRKVAKGEVATPCGMVYCEWEIRGNEIIINIKLPNNKQAELIMPDGTRSLIGSGIYIYHIKNSRED